MRTLCCCTSIVLRSENDEESLGAKFALNLPQPADSIINSAVHFPIFCCCCFFFCFFFSSFLSLWSICAMLCVPASMKISITSRRWSFLFIYLFLLLFARWFIFDCQPYVLLPGAGELLVHLQRNATINPCRLGERRVAAWVFSSCVRVLVPCERALARVQSYKLAHTDINYATDSIHATCVCVYTNIL